MRRRNSSISESDATTAAAITRTQSLPSVDGSDGKMRWLRRESFTDRLRSKFKKREEPARSRSQSLSGAPQPLAQSPPGASQTVTDPVRASASPPPPQPKPRQKCTKIPKRVGFHTDVLLIDPPQQIPPQKPRKGCVEIVNGEVKLPADRLRNTGEYSYTQPIHAAITASAAKTAHENATRLHSSLSKGGLFGRFKDDDEDDVPASKIKAEVETSMAAVVQHFPSDDETDDDSSEPISASLTPEKIYTRCCHLREILPIRSMIRQLSSQEYPIPELHIVNVKPTMIEFLAFTDLLRIVPVVWVRMDSIVLEPEMVRILMSSLLTSTHLTKLSFQNTQLDTRSWEYLCSFIANGSRLLSLDLSCTDTVTRVEPFTRENVDWSLLADALCKCKTVDSLILSGTMIPLSEWKVLASRGFSNGRSIALANNKLNHEYIAEIVDWLVQPECNCLGLDLAGNDLSNCYSLLRKILYSSQVQRLNVSNTSLVFDTSFAEIFTAEMATNSSLKSLEINGNPQLFPEIIDHLFNTLPHFLKLRRIELNNCNLNSANVVRLCQAFVQCQELVHISLTDNGDLNETAAASLCVVANTVKSIVQIDVDTSKWPDSFKHQLSSYFITNINNVENKDQERSGEMFSFEQELQAIKDGIHQSTSSTEIPQHVFDRILELRADSRQKLGNLFKERRTRTLSVQEQETMFKLFFYDSSLERVISQVKESRSKHKKPAEQLPSVTESVQEDVHTLDTPRHSLSRAGSSASLASLKQIEEEEGTFHKLNTWLMLKKSNMQDPDTSEDGEGRDALRLILEQENPDLSDDIIQRIKSYTAKDLAREISSEH